MSNPRRVYTHCRVCKLPLMTEWKWRRTSPEGRKGFVQHQGHGLCKRDHSRWKRTGKLTTERQWLKPPATAEDVPVVGDCRDCEQPMVGQNNLNRFPELREKFKMLGGQGLCTRCYAKRWKAGNLETVDTRPLEDVLEDWEWLRDDGVPFDVAAKRMDMTTDALDRALGKARAKGDLRGSKVPFGHDMRQSAA